MGWKRSDDKSNNGKLLVCDEFFALIRETFQSAASGRHGPEGNPKSAGASIAASSHKLLWRHSRGPRLDRRERNRVGRLVCWIGDARTDGA